MNSEKTFYYSLIWKELSENVRLFDTGTLEKGVVLFASNSLKISVLLDIWKSVQYCLGVTLENVSITWCLETCVVLFGSNFLKVPVMFDMNSENVFTLVW